MERCVWTRAEDLVPGGSAFDRTEGVKINGQCVRVSWFAGESRVNLVEVNGDAIFGVCPKGIVSAVAGRVSGYAVFGRHSVFAACSSRCTSDGGVSAMASPYEGVLSSHWVAGGSSTKLDIR